jgi:transcriptional regulator GlxA family with amidase domain
VHNINTSARSDLRAVLSRVDRALLRLPEVSVRVSDIAHAAGVSTRTLYRAFARHRGAPPISHLRRSRLEQVRCRLESAQAGDTVSAIALDFGFSHLGRFASSYRRVFGETPSETLRRARLALDPRGFPARVRPGTFSAPLRLPRPA